MRHFFSFLFHFHFLFAFVAHFFHFYSFIIFYSFIGGCCCCCYFYVKLILCWIRACETVVSICYVFCRCCRRHHCHLFDFEWHWCVTNRTIIMLYICCVVAFATYGRIIIVQCTMYIHYISIWFNALRSRRAHTRSCGRPSHDMSSLVAGLDSYVHSGYTLHTTQLRKKYLQNRWYPPMSIKWAKMVHSV